MNQLPRVKPPREQIPAGEIPCIYCSAKCCKYFALPIDTPENREGFDYIRWFLLHDRATVFIEDETWYLLVHTQCRHLRSDNLCGIYEIRPQICRDYSYNKCEYEDDWCYEMYFEHPDQVVEYVEARFNKPGKPGFRTPKPAAFPILR